MEISPIAHVALLQTEMNSGLRLVPNIGMKSARKKKKLLNYVLNFSIAVFCALKEIYQMETETETKYNL